MTWTFIWKMRVTNLIKSNGYPDTFRAFPQPLPVNSGICLDQGPTAFSRILSNSSAFHSTLKFSIVTASLNNPYNCLYFVYSQATDTLLRVTSRHGQHNPQFPVKTSSCHTHILLLREISSTDGHGGQHNNTDSAYWSNIFSAVTKYGFAKYRAHTSAFATPQMYCKT